MNSKSPAFRGLIVLTILFSSLFQAFGAEARAYRSDRLLLKPKDSFKTSVTKGKPGRRVSKSFQALGGIQVLELAPGDDIEAVLEEYRESGLFEFVEPDYTLRAAVLPNDPNFSLQWPLRNSTTGRDIHASQGWDIMRSASNIIVAVIDSGVRYTHEDLAGNMWVNRGEIPGNGIDDDRNGIIDDVHGINAIAKSGDPMDDAGHGTHVAGIIGAVGNNGVGISGVAWNVRIMACKFLDRFGEGDTSDAIQAIDYARRMGAHIINASFGGPDYSTALYTAINNARAAGIIVVAAAGNDSIDLDQYPLYPASFNLDNIVVVGGTSRGDSLDLGYSNYGALSVDLMAPGSGIYSTWSSNDRSYNYSSGTSMAAPHVAGILALMKARFSEMSSSQVIARLLESVDVIPGLSGQCRTGGRANLARALGPNPAAGFNASTWLGQPPLAVSFMNQSFGEVAGFSWDFGDGAPGSSEENPSHLFTRAGEFKVRLTVVGANGQTNSTEQVVRVVSNYTFVSAPYQWIDPAGMTRLSLTDNGVSPARELPFPFTFYGVEQTEIYVGANGVLSFSPSGLSTTGNSTLPNPSAPNALIAPYWDNLNPAAGGSVYVGTVGTAPRRRFVASWVNVPRVSTPAYLTFQAILEETTGAIVFQYHSVEGGRAAGRGATVGLENAAGDFGVLYTYNGSPALLSNRTAIRAEAHSYGYLEHAAADSDLFTGGLGGPFSPAVVPFVLRNAGNKALEWTARAEMPWIASDPAGGTLGAREEITVYAHLTGSAEALASGTHLGGIELVNLSDSSATPLRQPIRLQVNSRVVQASAQVEGLNFSGVLPVLEEGNYAVEFSNDLENWTLLQTVESAEGVISFNDFIGLTRRFYRARLQ